MQVLVVDLAACDVCSKQVEVVRSGAQLVQSIHLFPSELFLLRLGREAAAQGDRLGGDGDLPCRSKWCRWLDDDRCRCPAKGCQDCRSWISNDSEMRVTRKMH